MHIYRLIAAPFFLLFVTAATGRCEPLNIHVAFDWLDNNGCPTCTVARLRLIVDPSAHLIFVNTAMMQSYSQMIGPHQRAIELDVSGAWKCSNNTVDRSEPDARLWGFNYETCVRLISYVGNAFVIDYTSRIKKPDGRYRLITDTVFNVNISGPQRCEAKLLSAQTAYEVSPNRMVPATAVRTQACNFVTAP